MREENPYQLLKYIIKPQCDISIRIHISVKIIGYPDIDPIKDRGRGTENQK